MSDIAHMLESGELPDWFPDEIREDALQHRRDLLRRHGMTLDTLREAVEEIIEVHREHFTDPNYAMYEHRSVTIRNGSPDFADRDRAILSRYLYAATLGEKTGLPLLIGNNHAGRVKQGEDYHDHQAVIAGNMRGKVGDNSSGEALAEIIGQLASERDSMGDFVPAPDLWDPLFDKLGTAGADPKLVRNPHAPRKTRYDYTADGKAKHITRGRFESRICEQRRKLFR
jgi:hypothetical protein